MNESKSTVSWSFLVKVGGGGKGVRLGEGNLSILYTRYSGTQ